MRSADLAMRHPSDHKFPQSGTIFIYIYKLIVYKSCRSSNQILVRSQTKKKERKKEKRMMKKKGGSCFLFPFRNEEDEEDETSALGEKKKVR